MLGNTRGHICGGEQTLLTKEKTFFFAILNEKLAWMAKERKRNRIA